ncbi:YusW family protein [Bacillus sp. PK3_68]|uniref:YusW family protein n=1 Tax=Bacillus sp. PK3_68 TaxID=2027408 RepID=UPI000E732C5A|nr:YusW family protein [Bacillus sp. PK3_68]RJS59066.1 hypothetical protein CJ483_02490 [Bacillus sp. PK3_68]
MKGVISIFLLIIALPLAACANKDEAQNQPDKAPVKGEGANATYPFTSFDLDVDMDGADDAIDVSYEQDKEGTEASYVNKTNNQNLTGDQAMNALDEIFSSFTFNDTTPDDEVLRSVEEAFDIPKDAKSVEVDIDFTGGTEKKYSR